VSSLNVAIILPSNFVVNTNSYKFLNDTSDIFADTGVVNFLYFNYYVILLVIIFFKIISKLIPDFKLTGKYLFSLLLYKQHYVSIYVFTLIILIRKLAVNF
jgi:hypothetical protein